MRRVAVQFMALAWLTALETLRQPTCLLLASAAVAIAALLPVVTSHTLGETHRMVADSVLALQFVFGMLLGGVAASQTLSGEIRRGTAAAVLSKPVNREVFFLAKFAGLALVILVFSGLLIAAGLLGIRATAEPFWINWWAELPLLLALPVAFALAGGVNFLTRRPFLADAFLFLVGTMAVAFLISGLVDADGRPIPFLSGYDPRFAPVGALIAMALLVLTGLAMALATRLETVPTLAVLSILLLAGMVSDHLVGRAAQTHAVAGVFYALLPNWQHFWLADSLYEEVPVPPAYFARAGLYALFYLLGTLGLGMVSFRHTEIKA